MNNQPEISQNKTKGLSKNAILSVILPPLSVYMNEHDAKLVGLNVVLTVLGWIPGVIHACLVVNDYQAEHRRTA